jgi:phosphoenolpyruvate-protein kinase (PTS system EI component)
MGGFLDRLDFLSIGTNDLIQYTLAVDRSDEAVSHLYDPLHPAIIKLLALAIGGANKAKVPIAVCGEMAGEVAMTRLLLGPRPARLLDASRARADGQAARAQLRRRGDQADRRAHQAHRLAREARRADRQAQRLTTVRRLRAPMTMA